VNGADKDIMKLEQMLWNYANGDVYAAGPGQAERLVQLDPERASAFARSLQSLHDGQMEDINLCSFTMSKKEIQGAKRCAESAAAARDWLVRYGAAPPG
jgi:hypothetical protein